MSHDTLPNFLTFRQTDNAPSPVSVPFGISFQGTKCTWETRKNRLVHGANTSSTARLSALDAWQVRTDFLAARGPYEMLAFLNRTGVFWKDNETFSWEDLEAFQRGIQHMVKTLPNQWKNARFAHPRVVFAIVNVFRSTVRFVWTPKTHAAITEAETTLQAIVTTVLLDKLRGAKFGFCARQDCGRQFPITSGHAKKYCDYECAHLVAVRKSRERKRKLQSVQTKTKPS